jgi:hypothetical protein
MGLINRVEYSKCYLIWDMSEHFKKDIE